MEPTTKYTVTETDSPSTKRVFLIMIGVLIGTLAVSGYFIFLVPTPAPVEIEKIVEKEKIVYANPAQSMLPPRMYDFRLIRTLDDNGATTTLSLDDTVVVDTVLTVLKKDKSASPYLNDKYNASYIIVSSIYAITAIGIPKDGGGNFYYVIDLKNNKLTDKFSAKGIYSQDKGTFIFGNDNDGLSYYTYGASSSVKLLNSTLSSNQSYREYEGPMGSSGFGLISTTTNSITFGVYNLKDTTQAVGDDVAHYKKVGERTFIIP